MCVVRDTDCDERSEARNARVRKSVGERERSVGERKRARESERERGRAKSNNAISGARDEVQSLETRSELQRGSETRGEVLLVFLVCTGEYIYNVKF